MLVTLGLIIMIGLSVVYSATWDEPGKHWLKQAMYVVMGVIAMGAIYLIPPKIFYAMAYPAWVASLFPLLYIIIFKANSVERWIALPGGFNLQPSELTKVALLLAMARLLSFQPITLKRPKTVIAPFMLFIFPFILVLNQPNLSTALSFVAMTTVMAYWSGLTFREIFLLASPVLSVALTFHQLAWALMFIVLIAIIVVSRINLKVAALLLLVNIIAGYGAIFVWNKVLYEHQRGRIMTFMDPQRDPLGAGYQVLQSKVAIGSGGLLGKGFLNGTQTNLSFLPEEHTDFIFSVLGEQFGFLGCVGVLTLYLFLLHRILRVGSDVRNRFVSLVAVGVAGILGFHIIVNVSMTIGLMPVTGLPLPFMSYGGSFLISCLLMIGLLVNLRAHGHNL
ncbi:MAG: putative rod shape-determining protein RodA [Fibrobacteres bacterium]|nr:putative rod shape-determining protein RodA [Fibrobacterota bacterium]